MLEVNGSRAADNRSYRLLLAALLLAAIALITLSLCLGQYIISPVECFRILFCRMLGRASAYPEIAENVILRLRLPRTLAAALVGGALAMSGAVYQGVFSNPLVSPDLLGVSAGSCVGAALAILLGFSGFILQGMAFAGGLLAVALTFLFPRLIRNASNLSLVLSGVIVGGMMASVIGLLKFTADPQTQLAEITYWQMGSFASVRFPALAAVLPAMLAAMAVLFAMSWWIDVISLGEVEARAVGANVRRVRAISILCATVLTACSICISGTIGWVGLVAPHIARMLAGSQHRRLLPVAVLLGAAFMVVVDTAARTLTPLELPVTILTGAIGAPLYAWILYRRRAAL